MLMILKMVVVSHMLIVAAGTMFQQNPEWDAVVACSFGGLFGSAVGVVLAVMSPPDDVKWKVYSLRWATNFVTSVGFAPFLYWWAYEKWLHLESPSPILAMFCGSLTGAMGIIALQCAMPFIKRKIRKSVENAETKIIVSKEE